VPKSDSQDVLDTVFISVPTYTFCGLCTNQSSSASNDADVAGLHVTKNLTCNTPTNAGEECVEGSSV